MMNWSILLLVVSSIVLIGRIRTLARAPVARSPRQWREEVAFTAGFALSLLVLGLQFFPQTDGVAVVISIAAGLCYLYAAILWLKMG
jgi:hypothetical protein